MAPNESSVLQVSAIDSGGQEGSQSNPVSVYSLTNPPTATFVIGLGSEFVTIAWSTNGNTGLTDYDVWCSSDNFATVVSSAGFITDSTYTVTGLNAQTTYYLKVRSSNRDGRPSAFDAVVSTVTSVGRPSGVAGTALGISSIAWTWSNIPGASQYRLYSSSGLIAYSTTASYAQSGLFSNEKHVLSVSAVDAQGVEGSLSNGATVYTMANPPSGTRVSESGSSAVTIAWSSNANVEPPVYEMAYSRTPFVLAITTVSGISLTSHTVRNLESNSTYYFRVRAYNGDQIVTVFDFTVSTLTALPAPSGLSGMALGISSISWTWLAVSSADQYRLYRDAVAIATVATPSYDETSLSVNQPYRVQVAAVQAGRQGDLSDAVTTYTHAVIQEKRKVASDAGLHVAGRVP
jgi:hypothetical protein